MLPPAIIILVSPHDLTTEKLDKSYCVLIAMPVRALVAVPGLAKCQIYNIVSMHGTVSLHKSVALTAKMN